jgi:outer membrane lipoprotein
MKKLLFLTALAFLLNSCSYAISPDLVKKADRGVSFAALMNDPDAFAGTVVIFGGVITLTSASKKGTVIEVVQKDLDYWGKPKRTKASGGRFLVLVSSFLDPTVYGPGRQITLAGSVAATKDKDLPENPSGLPVLRSQELKLWPKEPQSGDRPSWWDPLHDPDDLTRQ